MAVNVTSVAGPALAKLPSRTAPASSMTAAVTAA